MIGRLVLIDQNLERKIPISSAALSYGSSYEGPKAAGTSFQFTPPERELKAISLSFDIAIGSKHTHTHHIDS